MSQNNIFGQFNFIGSAPNVSSADDDDGCHLQVLPLVLHADPH